MRFILFLITIQFHFSYNDLQMFETTVNTIIQIRWKILLDEQTRK